MNLLRANGISFRALRDRIGLRSYGKLGKDVRIQGSIWVHGAGAISIGDRVVFDARRGPIELHACRGARLHLEDEVVLEGGVSIEAVDSVRLGPGCVVGAWSKILDNHFHEVQGDRQHRPGSEPVWIGRGVRIGERCIVLPGTRLEDGVRLGHGVVIGRRVPAGTLLEGSPPRRVAEGGLR